jgi:hypothetical protein
MKVTTGVPAIRRATQPQEELPRHTRQQGRGRWLMGCIVGMGIIAVFLFIMFRVIMPFYQDIAHHWQYGEAQVYHMRADIGRGVPSDIYTMSTQGSVVVVIVSKDRTEMYPMRMQSTGNSLVIITAMDMNQDGKPDLVLHVDGSDISTVLYNTGSAFRDRP